MTRRLASSTGCALLLMLTMTGAGLSVAHAGGAINVTALPAPCVSAIPNDGGDDTAAFTCAIGLIPTSGVPGIYHGAEIYIPAGTYDLYQTISVTDRPVAFRGEGQGITRLLWHQTTAPEYHGLKFVSNASGVNFTLSVRSLSLLRDLGTGGAALSARWVKPTWHGLHGIVTARIHDVQIGRPTADSGAYWDHGIQLINATTAKIDTFNIQGPAWNNGISAIQIRGTDQNGKSIGTQIRNGSITRWVRGIEVLHEAEGLHVQDVNIYETNWGINFYYAGTGTVIANNNIQARARGIQLYDSHHAGMAISNNLIRRFGEDYWVGIELYDTPVAVNQFQREGNGARLIGNSIVSPTTGTLPHGIVLGGFVRDTMIMGNTTENMNVGIFLSSATVERTTVVGNINKTAVNPWVNWGTSNHVLHNTF